MILDWYAKGQTFTLAVNRHEADPHVMMADHGLDLSLALSTPETAVLFTREPYAAVAFHEWATPAAKAQLFSLQADIASSWKQESQGHIDCPADQELAGFQIAGVEYALQRTHSLIGDQPGLGKTMQAICIANEMRAKRTLVLCPANIRLQWVERIRSWTTLTWPYTIYPIMHGRHGVHPTAEWTVVSYDLARTIPIWKALAEGRYDLCILDEGHYLKTIDAARTRTVFGGGQNPEAPSLSSVSQHIVALSGTPLPNRPREAYTLARGLCWESIDWLSEEKFSERFNPSETRETDEGKIYVDERSGRHGELQARMRANFMVRRLKRTVLPQLKLPVLDIVHVEETGPIRAALNAEKLLDIDPENLEGLDMKTFGSVSTVRRMMGLALAPQAAEYIQMVLDGGEEKVVVFAWHVEVLDILMKKLAKFNPLRIDGSTPPSRKPSIVATFAQPGRRLLVGNILSLGTGTDGLQEACRHGIAAECSWVPGDNEQAIDRLDRWGQVQGVEFEFLCAKGSFSEHVLGSSIRKRTNTHRALDQQLSA